MIFIAVYDADNDEIIDQFADETYLFFEGTDEMRHLTTFIIRDESDLEYAFDKMNELL